MKLILTCARCGVRAEAKLTPGDVGEIVIEHESGCAFLEAIEAGCVRDWIEANGYPIRACAETEAKR